MSKVSKGNFFEDFKIGQEIVHATPRTVRDGDVTAYMALTGSRFVLESSALAAKRLGMKASPIDDLMMFHIVFGKSVPDVSLNAVANLGYAEGRFLAKAFAGDTLSARSEVIGLKANSNGKTGNVYVRTTGYRDGDEPVLDYVRWVMVNRRQPGAPGFEPVIPELKGHVAVQDLILPKELGEISLLADESGSPLAFEDYEVGERIDHVDGMGVMESEHRLATRLYQNTARVHFNDFSESKGRLGSTIVYGGVVISLARALSYNGLANSCGVLAINGGRHVNPCIAGDTVFAWSEVLDKALLREDAGALRLRLVATKNLPCADHPLKDEDGKYRREVLLDFDFWVLMPTGAAIR